MRKHGLMLGIQLLGIRIDCHYFQCFLILQMEYLPQINLRQNAQVSFLVAFWVILRQYTHLDFSLDFCPETLGEFTLKGDQLCGYQHPNLIGKVNVVAPREFLKWRDGIISEQRGRQHD